LNPSKNLAKPYKCLGKSEPNERREKGEEVYSWS
jgi:hypothetical protein